MILRMPPDGCKGADVVVVKVVDGVVGVGVDVEGRVEGGTV
jgi:hypothetical protein